jgi:hypothetical protein
LGHGFNKVFNASSALCGLADFYRKVWALGNAGIDVPLSLLQGIRIRDIKVRSIDRYQFLQMKLRKAISL